MFFFPAGVLSARFLKHRDPLWWHLHRGFQSFGFVLFLIAMGLSLKAKALNGTYSTAHKGLGVFLLVAVILQASSKHFHGGRNQSRRPGNLVRDL